MTNRLTATDDDGLEQHLRRVLHEVALAAVAPEPAVRPTRGRRLFVGLAATGLALGSIAAWNTLDPGEIQRIPVESALASGTASDGTSWWMLPTDAVLDDCGGVPRGVVLVGDDQNRAGFEWDMMGVQYGEPPVSDIACTPHDEAAWLDDPSVADFGRTSVGGDDGDWGYLGAVHPSVSSVEVTLPGAPTFAVRTHALDGQADGGRYTAFTVDADVDPSEVSIVLVSEDGDRVLPSR